MNILILEKLIFINFMINFKRIIIKHYWKIFTNINEFNHLNKN